MARTDPNRDTDEIIDRLYAVNGRAIDLTEAARVTPQLASALTEPFRRGAERLRTHHAGVGLGLAVVKTITRAHDGTLTLTPRPEGGIRITVELPATAPPADGVRTSYGRMEP